MRHTTPSMALVLLSSMGLFACHCAPEPSFLEPDGGPDSGRTDAQSDGSTDAQSDAEGADVLGPRELIIAPLDAEGFIDERVAFHAYLQDLEGNREDVTGTAEWSVSDAEVGAIQAPGVVLILGAGTATVTATLGDDTVEGTVKGRGLESGVVDLTVVPADIEVQVDQTTGVAAMAVYDDGQARDVSEQAIWENRSPELLAIEPWSTESSTRLRGLAEGEGGIRVSFAGLEAEVTVAVTVETLVDIELYPAEPIVPAGATAQLWAIGRFSDGALNDVTDAVTWSVDDEEVATVSNAADSQGLLTGVAEGVVTVTATDEVTAVTASAVVTVTAAAIRSLDVMPAVIRIAAGTSTWLQATAVLDDTLSMDVTLEATWTVADPEVALLVESPYGAPQLEGIYPAETTLTATYAGLTTQVPVTVTDAQLESLEIWPEEVRLAAGTSEPLYLLGTYSDGSRPNLTAQASWSSSAPDVALVSDSQPGYLRGVTPGRATITARVGDMETSVEAVVTDATVVAIQINPRSYAIPEGEDVQFEASAVYSDNSQRYFTNQVTWSVSEEEVATISNAYGQQGRAVGVASGTVDVVATYEGLRDEATLTVTDASVSSIMLTPDPMVLSMGRDEPMYAYATYSNGITLYVSDQVSWSSSDDDRVRVSNGDGTRGWVTALAPGVATVTARLGGAEGTATVSVIEREVDEIFIYPEWISLVPGVSEQVDVYGMYSDQPYTYKLLTQDAIWDTSAADVATVGNYPNSAGRIFGHAPGTVTITATYAGIEASTAFEVTPATLEGIEISPPNPTIAHDSFLTYVVLGNFVGGTARDVTADAITTSDDNTVVSVYEYYPGLAVGLAAGTATLHAELDGHEATSEVTVIEATPQNVILTPVNPVADVFDPVEMYATAIYDDGSTGDVTFLCSWASSNTDVLLLLDDVWSKGYGYAMAAGSATVTIVCGEFEDSTLVTVR